MKEILEKIDNVIQDLATMNSRLYNGSFEQLSNMRLYLIRIKSDLEAQIKKQSESERKTVITIIDDTCQKKSDADSNKIIDWFTTLPLTTTYGSMPSAGTIRFNQLIKELQEKLRPTSKPAKTPKLSIAERIEQIRKTGEKPTTGGYNESELRSMSEIFEIKDHDVIRENHKLVIDKKTGYFIVILKTNEYYLPLSLENIFKDHIGENLIDFCRLPTRREKAIFYEFYPEYRNEVKEPEKVVKIYDLKEYEITIDNFELYKGLYLFLSAFGGITVKLVKMKNNNLWLKPAHTTKKESITILTKDIFQCCRYATELEIAEYKENEVKK